jgi:carbamate kinase
MLINMTVVIALGGNAILTENDKGTFEEQLKNVEKSCDPIIDLIEKGYRVIITHGNGPQVGLNLIKVEAAAEVVPPYPLHACGSETQGFIGYIIQQALRNRMKERNINKEIAAVITQVVVNSDDTAFQNPTKPIGPFFSKERAEEMGKSNNLIYVEDSGRGYRRVVPSPKPIKIVEKKVIETLIENDVLVITVGGGGIPVIEEYGKYKGVDAVIDKDHASGVLAKEINADYLVILTGVEKVAINFGKPNQQSLDVMKVSEAKYHLEDGQFPPGSMGPKIVSAINFIESGGKTAIITSIDKLKDALEGKTGTKIIQD